MSRSFSSFKAMAQHFEQARNNLVHDVTVALEAIGSDVEHRAKAKIGQYQSAVVGGHGFEGFPAWAPLAQSTMEDRVRQHYTPNDPLLRTGHLRESIAHRMGETNRARTVVIGSPDPIAEYQEYGTRSIPPRPFIGPAMAEAEPESIEKIAAAVRAAFRRA